MIKNGFSASTNPVLRPLETIECRDALLTWLENEGEEGRWTEAEWPDADAIIGNPPFLGSKVMRSELGDSVVDTLFPLYRDRVSPEADFVTYWVNKAAVAIHLGKSSRAGLVTTNSIRNGASRKVLDAVTERMSIVTAWADEPWTVEGAAVRVSMIVFGSLGHGEVPLLNGKPVQQINSDLSDRGFDLTKAATLRENVAIAYQGITRGAPFDLEARSARQMLLEPQNPNGRPNSDVIIQMKSGGDIVQGRPPRWVIDFTGLSEQEAAFFESPFNHILHTVRPIRLNNRRERYRDLWWLFSETRSGLRAAIAPLQRFIVTPKVAKHRIFVWMGRGEIGDNLTICIARDDDVTMGVLQSRFHELWALGLGAWIGQGNDPTYTPTTTFGTFPFPEGLTPNIPAAEYMADHRATAIADAARRLNELRENWLKPPGLTRIESEVVPGYPDRLIPIDEESEQKLKYRTLTSLYNACPTWLQNAHRALDEAVALAYGWPANISDGEILARLFALNQERALKQ